MAKYEVIALHDGQDRPTFWNGQDLVKKGTVVDIDPEVCKVAYNSKSLKPVGDSPVFKKNEAGDWIAVVKPKEDAKK